MDLEAELARLRHEIERVRAENDRLHQENRHLQAVLDAHVCRAGSTASFGPLEMTAGTCIGPRRKRL